MHTGLLRASDNIRTDFPQSPPVLAMPRSAQDHSPPVQPDPVYNNNPPTMTHG